MRTKATTLKDLSSEAARLGKRLQSLAERYPDDSFEPDQRIFNRILTNDWRHAHGGVHGPFERRYWDAVTWVEGFDSYVKQLAEHFSYELEQSERLTTLPLTRRLRLPATEIIRLLKLQRDMLTKWARAADAARPQGRNEKLLERIRQQAKAIGMEALADKIGCNRDTLSDFLLGKTKPQEKTMKKLRAYGQSD